MTHPPPPGLLVWLSPPHLCRVCFLLEGPPLSHQPSLSPGPSRCLWALIFVSLFHPLP